MVAPTAAITVDSTATPSALPSWRTALNRVDARPVLARSIWAMLAACDGHDDVGHRSSPATNIRTRICHSWSRLEIVVISSIVAPSADQPADHHPARPEARVEQPADHLGAEHHAERLGERRRARTAARDSPRPSWKNSATTYSMPRKAAGGDEQHAWSSGRAGC